MLKENWVIECFRILWKIQDKDEKKKDYTNEEQKHNRLRLQNFSFTCEFDPDLLIEKEFHVSILFFLSGFNTHKNVEIFVLTLSLEGKIKRTYVIINVWIADSGTGNRLKTKGHPAKHLTFGMEKLFRSFLMRNMTR